MTYKVDEHGHSMLLRLQKCIYFLHKLSIKPIKVLIFIFTFQYRGSYGLKYVVDCVYV